MPDSDTLMLLALHKREGVTAQELETLHFLISEYFPTKDAAQAANVLRRLSAELAALKKAIREARPVAWQYTELRTSGSCSPPCREACVSNNPYFKNYEGTQPLYTLEGIK